MQHGGLRQVNRGGCGGKIGCQRGGHVGHGVRGGGGARSALDDGHALHQDVGDLGGGGLHLGGGGLLRRGAAAERNGDGVQGLQVGRGGQAQRGQHVGLRLCQGGAGIHHGLHHGGERVDHAGAVGGGHHAGEGQVGGDVGAARGGQFAGGALQGEGAKGIGGGLGFAGVPDAVAVGVGKYGGAADVAVGQYAGGGAGGHHRGHGGGESRRGGAQGGGGGDRGHGGAGRVGGAGAGVPGRLCRGIQGSGEIVGVGQAVGDGVDVDAQHVGLHGIDQGADGFAPGVEFRHPVSLADRIRGAAKEVLVDLLDPLVGGHAGIQ